MDIKSIIANYKAIAPKHCDNCGQPYSENDYKVVRNQSGQLVVHLQCSICQNSYMLNIFSPMQGVLGSTRSNINLDLNDQEELLKFANAEVITVNEALDAYYAISKGGALNSYLPKNDRSSLSRITLS